MKKWIISFLIVLLLPVFVYAETCDTSNITITSIKKINSTGYTEEIEEPSTDNTSVSTNLKLYDVGDSITYEIKVKNKSNKDYDLNKKINNSEYVSYEIVSNDNKVKANEEKTIDLKVEYKKKVPDDLYKSNKFVENKQIDLIVEDYIINPSTGRNIIITLIILLVILLSFLSIKKDLKYRSLLLLLFIPIIVDAACEYKLSVNSRVEFKKILPNPCTYEGELVQGALYKNGDYYYMYKGEGGISSFDGDFEWVPMDNDGWGVAIDPDIYGEPVTSKLCTSINDKPIVSMKLMFYRSSVQEVDFSSYDTSNVTTMEGMFAVSGLGTLNLSSFDTSNVTNMSAMFSSFSITSVDLSSFDTSSVTDMSYMFNYTDAMLDLSAFDTSGVTTMKGMFYRNNSLSLDLSGFDTSKVTDMSYMFADSVVSSLNLESFNTKNVTDMSYMFDNSEATSIDFSSFDTSNVTNMSQMFSYTQVTTLDLSGFDTGNVTNMYKMFSYTQVTTLDLSGFDTSNVTNMSYMFAYTKVTTLDLSGFDTNKVTDMSDMFYGSVVSSLNLKSFNTKNVTNMSWMFAYTKVTTLDLSSFDMSNVTYTYNMFANSQATTGYGRTQADCDKFNASNNKPSELIFVVKS